MKSWKHVLILILFNVSTTVYLLSGLNASPSNTRFVIQVKGIFQHFCKLTLLLLLLYIQILLAKHIVNLKVINMLFWFNRSKTIWKSTSGLRQTDSSLASRMECTTSRRTILKRRRRGCWDSKRPRRSWAGPSTWEPWTCWARRKSRYITCST